MFKSKTLKNFRKNYRNFRLGLSKGSKGEIFDIFIEKYDDEIKNYIYKFKLIDPVDKNIRDKIVFTYCQICFNDVNVTCWIKLKCNQL